MMQMFSFNFRFYSDSRPHFRSKSVQRFLYFNKIGYFVHKRRVCKEQWELVLQITKWIFLYDADVFFQFSITNRILYLISDPNQSRDSYITIKLDTFVHKRRVCKFQWELVLLFTKLDISIWCRFLHSIFDFDSDSRLHFRSESVQRFIYFNKIGYFVHKLRVCKEQWELLSPFTKLDISIWCRCFLSIFDFDSDSRPHFRSESVHRFIYFNKIGYFVHKRRVCKEQWELVLQITKWIFLYDADVFFQFSIMIRILYLISDPNQSRDWYILIKLDTLSIRVVFLRINGNYYYHSLNWIYLYDADVFFQFSIMIRILDLISDPNQSRDSYT